VDRGLRQTLATGRQLPSRFHHPCGCPRKRRPAPQVSTLAVLRHDRKNLSPSPGTALSLTSSRPAPERRLELGSSRDGRHGVVAACISSRPGSSVAGVRAPVKSGSVVRPETMVITRPCRWGGQAAPTTTIIRACRPVLRDDVPGALRNLRRPRREADAAWHRGGWPVAQDSQHPPRGETKRQICNTRDRCLRRRVCPSPLCRAGATLRPNCNTRGNDDRRPSLGRPRFSAMVARIVTGRGGAGARGGRPGGPEAGRWRE